MSIKDESQSSKDSLGGDMSYLYGRDPSILAYGQRPFPSQESKKNLISLLEEEDEEDEKNEKDNASYVKVFLRMKPFPQRIKMTPEQKDAYKIVNSTTLLTRIPSFDTNTSCLKNVKSSMVSRKFIFTQTFGSDTSQLELFEQAVKSQMLDFLAGKNSVLMSYGTTNSGKTYTLQGTVESPGIIPRGIEFVFSNINPRAMPSFKPVNLCDVTYLSNKEQIQETDIKMKLFSFNIMDKNSYINTYKQMQQLVHEESPIRPNHNYDAHYSVWISFAEIYNETIYDLLWTDCQKKRPALKLSTDKQGRAFIKGLKSISVNSGAEAYQVLMVGQNNLKVAATALNSRSSRSHCIFTIKLLKYKNDHDLNSVEVSIFTFCDLAGSERLKKTLNVGERLKEAQNINTSLLVLGRCLKTIYESQNSSKLKNESIGPFRESKLTRLFQRALSGKEKMALIVNVNPLPNLYDETQNVLNFAAIAKKIVIEKIDPIKKRHSHSRFSRLVTQSIKTDVDWENTELEDMPETTEEYTEQELDIEEDSNEAQESLIYENEMLKKEIKELRASILTRDMQTRQEMVIMYDEIMKKLEENWKNRLTDMEAQQEDLLELAVERVESIYKDKLNKLNLRKRSRPSITDDDDLDETCLEDLEIENTRLLTKIETMRKAMRDLKTTKTDLESEKTKMSFELAVAKEEMKRINEKLAAAEKSISAGDDVANVYIEELKDLINKKDDRIQTMKTFLNEAKEEYICITNEAREMENQIYEQNKLLAENSEQIKDLEDQLRMANEYSAKLNKCIESMEEDLEKQIKKIKELEEKEKNLTEQSITPSTLDNADDEKVQDLIDTNEKAKEEKPTMTVEQGIQTEFDESSIKELIMPSMANISCQTIETLPAETDEKGLQTSLCLNQSLDKNEIEKNIEEKENEIETVNAESFNELQKQYEEIKEALEARKAEHTKDRNQFEETIRNLQTQITEISAQEQEKNGNNSALQKELKELIDREQDKDEEIYTLKKEIKSLIQSNEESEKKMEVEIKKIFKDLNATKEQLVKAEEKNKRMDSDYRKVIHILEMKIGTFEQKMLEKQEESQKLKLEIENLKKNLSDEKHELEVFTRNRDVTVERYENLVTSQHTELEQYKNEITRLENLLQEEEKQIHNSKPKKEFLSPPHQTIELSDAESQKSTTKSTKGAPTPKRKTKKKQLFTLHDDSFVEINQSEPSPSPCSTRSLRNRRR